ncbi:Nucleosome-remodeling factor subunit BPTF [Termitomyces sp. J132]|nr:Nucleosome-remodeling factor subunit BPTF [Termitomyces sp. J132]
MHHEQLLRQEQQHHQNYVRERQAIYTERPVLSPPSHSIRGASVSLHGESPVQLQPHPQLPPPPPPPRPPTNHQHPSGRKSDPGQPHHVFHPGPVPPLSAPPFPQAAGDSVPHSSKRRRYSEVSVEEQERIQREREKMVTGDLGYGRPEPIINSGNPGPSRPDSSHGQGVMPEGREGNLQLSTPHDGKSRDSSPPEGGLRLITPHRRRSPPGSQSGRALAAKKTEEVELSLHDLLPQAPEPIQPPEIERKSPLQEREKAALHEKKETKKRTPSQTMVDHSTLAEPRPSKKQRTVSVASAPKAAEEDAHEWFLEHFDDYNEPRQSRLLSPRDQSPPARPSPPSRHSSRARTRTPTPSAMPDAADALEQELEELLPDPPQISKVEPMEVDLVTELVAETLDADDAKIEDVGMEVDVEDELLSLLDDQPTSRRTITKSAKVPPSTVKPPPPSGTSGGRHISPSGMSPVSVPSPATHVPPTGRSASARPASERESMPPPTSVTPVRGKEEKVTERASSSVAPNKKKKDALSKSGAKNKVTPAVSAGTKPRARPGPKPKPKISDASLSATAAKSKAATGNKKQAASRSRSTSVMPNGSAGPEGSEAKTEKQEEEEESDQEDDKLYCVCKTTYDEDRFMIACDRCDDWYHTQCVNMPDLEVDLVDQFICPPCIEKHPHLNLKTTYKTRCLYGLSHPDPSSPEACHRPARGAFSKFCSDECGSKCMQSRVDAWVKKGGKKEKLWETVKNAEKREGVVVCAMELNGTKSDVDKDNEDQNHKQKKSKTEREIGRLNGLLDSVVKLREDIKKEMECVMWREKLLELATTRAEQIEECGWDQRLCFGDDQCADLGAGVLESYDLHDGDKDVSSGDWWCSGKKVCDRHAGWQAVRVKDVCKEKEKKNDALMNLTTREREIRKQIEDLLEPHGRDCNDTAGKLPLTATNAKLPNGHTKGKTNGDTTTKKGKKRKAPS